MTEALLAPAPAPIPLTAGGYTFAMIPVEGTKEGTFDMGDEHGDLWDACRPVHPVRLREYCIGQFPVTQVLWKAVMNGENPSFFKGDNRPVEQVSWEDVQVFIEKLNVLLPGRGFRLPTEAEWEYAARGGRVSLPGGEGRGGVLCYAGSDRLETVGWWDGNSHGETKPVGLKMPNQLGLFDMSGNVWEWCEDWFDEKFYEKCATKGTVENPRNDEKGSHRVLRGGSWFRDPGLCRVAYRYYSIPEDRYGNLGFRLAASPSSQW